MERGINDGHALINNALGTAMKELQYKVDTGKNVSMSEFAKLLIWAKNENAKLFAKEEEIARLHGSKFSERKWCGSPVC